VETLGKPSFRRAQAVAIAFCAGATIVIGALPAAAHHESSRCRDAAPVPNPFVKLLAHDTTFDADCLAVPADRAFRIYLKNEDRDLAHNVSIYAADGPNTKAIEAKDEKDAKGGKEPDKAAKPKPKPLFKGKSFKGPAQEEYAIDALPAGNYRFQCDTHPEDMDGSLVVLKKK